jgi:hypothetical protein
VIDECVFLTGKNLQLARNYLTDYHEPGPRGSSARLATHLAHSMNAFVCASSSRPRNFLQDTEVLFFDRTREK